MARSENLLDAQTKRRTENSTVMLQQVWSLKQDIKNSYESCNNEREWHELASYLLTKSYYSIARNLQARLDFVLLLSHALRVVPVPVPLSQQFLDQDFGRTDKDFLPKMSWTKFFSG